MLLRELPFTAKTLSYVAEGGTTVQPEHHLKDFGVWLSADSTRTYHIAGKANRIAGCICILNVYIHPILEYCCLVWSPSRLADIQALENVQRAFLRKNCGMNESGAVGNTELNVPSDATPELRASTCLEDLSWTST